MNRASVLEEVELPFKITSKVTKVTSTSTHPYRAFEAIMATLDSGNRRITFLNIYRPLHVLEEPKANGGVGV